MEPVQANSKVHTHAVETLFEVFEEMCEGAVSVDRNARIVWINKKYRALLGVAKIDDVLGRNIEEVIPESLMRRVVETGKPIPVDIMRFGDRHFVVSRLPLRDEHGEVIGAVGFVLYDSLDYLRPLISKFEALQDRLRAAEAQLATERRARYSIANIVGTHPRMVEIRRQARRIARLASPVLLIGETGTGKELFAHSIHAASHRADGPFVAVNMAAIPETLLEAEFFGVAPGAFTGADRRGRKGKFDVASGGTLFMDEITDLPIQLQPKLLRILEEQVIEPVGSNDVRKIDVRVIAATSQDMKTRIHEGKFRSDLYYRLDVLQIHIPPLRDRLMDMRPLCEILFERIALANVDVAREIDDDALALLQKQCWPGNVRELRNVLERACLLTDQRVLGFDVFAELLPIGDSEVGPDRTGEAAAVNLQDRVAILEREAIVEALTATNGKKAAAARLLGISRSTLYEKLAEFNLSYFRT